MTGGAIRHPQRNDATAAVQADPGVMHFGFTLAGGALFHLNIAHDKAKRIHERDSRTYHHQRHFVALLGEAGYKVALLILVQE